MPDTLTPGALAARLSVADRTVRRMAEAYEAVHGQLPRDRRGHRLFPVEAADRLEVAARALRSAPGASMVEVLTAQRDGLPMPRHADVPPPADTLAPLLAEIRALRLELVDLRALVLALSAPQRPDMTLADRDPDSDPANGGATFSQPRKLQAKHERLLERLQAGTRLTDNGGHSLEKDPDGQTRRVDPRTVAALVRYGLLIRDGDEYRLTYFPLLDSNNP